MVSQYFIKPGKEMINKVKRVLRAHGCQNRSGPLVPPSPW